MDEQYTAWMIREDGKAIPCVQHIYGSLECIEETLYAAEWLFKNTVKEDTKDLVLRFISAYAVSLNPVGDPVRNLLQKIQGQPYVTLTEDFIKEIGGGFHGAEDEEDVKEDANEDANEDVDEDAEEDAEEDADEDEGNLGKLNRLVCEELNKEFLRARLGGMYSTGKLSRDMYFRVSSDDYNWAGVLREFVAGHMDEIETVTVVYDEESTGHGEPLKDTSGNDIDHIPPDIALSKIFVN